MIMDHSSSHCSNSNNNNNNNNNNIHSSNNRDDGNNDNVMMDICDDDDASGEENTSITAQQRQQQSMTTKTVMCGNCVALNEAEGNGAVVVVVAANSNTNNNQNITTSNTNTTIHHLNHEPNGSSSSSTNDSSREVVRMVLDREIRRMEQQQQQQQLQAQAQQQQQLQQEQEEDDTCETTSIIKSLLNYELAISSPINGTLFAMCISLLTTKLDYLFHSLQHREESSIFYLGQLFKFFETHVIENMNLIRVSNDERRRVASGEMISSVLCNCQIVTQFLRIFKVTGRELVTPTCEKLGKKWINEKVWFNFLLFCCSKDMSESLHEEAMHTLAQSAIWCSEYFQHVILGQMFDKASNGSILREADGLYDMVFITSNAQLSDKLEDAYCKTITPYLEKGLFLNDVPPEHLQSTFLFPLCCSSNVFDVETQKKIAYCLVKHLERSEDPNFLTRLIFIIDICGRDFKRRTNACWLFQHLIEYTSQVTNRLVAITQTRNNPKLRYLALSVIGRTCYETDMRKWRDLSYQLFWDILQIEIMEKETKNVVSVVGFFIASHRTFVAELREEHIPKMNALCHNMFTHIIEYDRSANDSFLKIVVLELLESVLLHGTDRINPDYIKYVWTLLNNVATDLAFDKNLQTAARCLQFFTQCFRVIYKRDPRTLISLLSQDWKLISNVVMKCLSSQNFEILYSVFIFLSRLTLKSLLLHIRFSEEDDNMSAPNKLAYLIDKSTKELSRICMSNREDARNCQKMKRDIAYFVSTLVLRYYNKQTEEGKQILLAALRRFMSAIFDENLLEYMSRSEDEIFRAYSMLSIDAVCTICMIDMNMLDDTVFYEHMGTTFLNALSVPIAATTRGQRTFYVFLRKLDETIETELKSKSLPQSSKQFLMMVIERKISEIQNKADMYQLFHPLALRVLNKIKLSVLDVDSEDEYESDSDS